MANLADVAYRVLTEQFSGGCKIIEFITMLVELIRDNGLGEDEMIVLTGVGLHNAMVEIVDACAKDPRLGVLNYTWQAEHGLNREKTFIYTK